MDLNIEEIDYGVLYKFLDEKEAYFTKGVWYVCKYNNSNSPKEPIIYVYNFDLNGKIVAIYCGNLINYNYQNGVEFNIKGWKIDKDSCIPDVGKEKTMEEMTFSVMTLSSPTQEEIDLLSQEVIRFLSDPTTYFNNKKGKNNK